MEKEEYNKEASPFDLETLTSIKSMIAALSDDELTASKNQLKVDIVAELIKEELCERGLEGELNEVNENDLVESLAFFDRSSILNIQANFKEMTVDELLFLQDHDHMDVIYKLIDEEMQKRSIEGQVISISQYLPGQTNKLDVIQVLSDSFKFIAENPIILAVGAVAGLFEFLISMVAYNLFILLIPFLVQIFLGGVVIKFVIEKQKGNQSWSTIITYVKNKYLVLFSFYVLPWILFYGGVNLPNLLGNELAELIFKVAVIPVVYIFIKMSLYMQVVIIENTSVIASIRRGWEITTGYFWPLVLLKVLSGLPVIIIMNLKQLFPGSYFLVGVLLNGFVFVFVNLVFTITYLHLVAGMGRKKNH